MKILYLWLKFNLVGAVGVVVQLSALALFNRWFRGHYLFATIAALELTLLHNFVWHLHYTWRDTTRHRSLAANLTQLLRFHLTNGLVSLVGNLALMRLLVAQTHLPMLAANAIAILCCSLVNFLMSHCWVFAANKSTLSRASMRTTTAILLLLFIASISTQAQTLPPTPQPQAAQSTIKTLKSIGPI